MAAEGFSAFLTTASVTGSTQLAGWSIAAPYYGSPSFDPLLGTFIVPETGRYSFEATINYTTTAAVTLSLGAGIDPAFVIRKTLPLPEIDLVTGLFPLLNIDVALILTLRTILGNGTVTLAGETELTVGDVVGLFYVADGLNIGLDLGGVGPGIVWSVHRLA